jgi:hypothetical protein
MPPGLPSGGLLNAKDDGGTAQIANLAGARGRRGMGPPLG